MIDRQLTGKKPKTFIPSGACDTQMHMYLPQFPMRADGVGVPADPLPVPAMYREVMAWLGLDRVVITQGNGHGHDNANLIACLAAMGPSARGVAVIDAQTDAATLERLAQAGVVGARIMDLPGGAVGLDQLEAVAERAAAMGWMVAVQFDGSALPELESRLAALPCEWVLDHHGKIFDGATQRHVDVVRRLLDRGRMYFKFAGCYEASRTGGPEYPDVAQMAREIGSHAPERIVWGTNWPHNACRETAEYVDDAALLDLAMGWLPDDPALRQLVLVDTPARLYRF